MILVYKENMKLGTAIFDATLVFQLLNTIILVLLIYVIYRGIRGLFRMFRKVDSIEKKLDELIKGKY